MCNSINEKFISKIFFFFFFEDGDGINFLNFFGSVETRYKFF